METTCQRCSKAAAHSDSFDETQLTSSTGQGMTEFCVINDDEVMSVNEATRTCNIQAEIIQWINQKDETQYPFCDICAKTLLETLTTLEEEAKQDNTRYNAFLGQTPNVNESENEIDAEIVALKKQESDNNALIRDLETGRRATFIKIRKAKEEAEAAKEIEGNFWDRVNSYEDHLNELQKLEIANDNKLSYFLKEIEKLQANKVISDLFSFDCSSDIGKINGMRLGSISEEFVPNSEINAACGYCVLLLYIISSRIPNFRSSVYSILPLGSSSAIIQPGSTFKIYEPETSSITAMAWSLVSASAFDNGLDVLLKCIRELVDWIQANDKTFHIPYHISSSEIDGISVRRGRVGDVKWTRVMIHMLDVLRLISIWFSVHYS